MKPMKLRHLLLAIAAIGAASGASAAERLIITVTHALDLARPAETITIPWTEVNNTLPGALLQRIAVKDAKGRILAHQVTNVAPQAKDPKNIGAAYGELIFQYNFAEGEKSAKFTVEKLENLASVFPTRTFGRYVPERLDDFGWENDKIAHRAYGPALAAPAEPGSNKEVLVTSGIDIWFKRVPYPIVDRWYNKGHDHYHHDEGEGMDMYNVGRSRGNGGTGIWDGKTLYVARNYSSWKVLANGPVRTTFELSYDAWDAAGVKVSEVKRFTVDAGHFLGQIDSTFTFSGPKELTVAVGLNKNPTDKGQEPNISVVQSPSDPSLIQWVQQKSNGAFGTAVVVPSASGEQAFASDDLNLLVLAKVTSGTPFRYYAGGGWSKGTDFATQQDWQKHVAEEASRARSPIKIALSSTQ